MPLKQERDHREEFCWFTFRFF